MRFELGLSGLVVVCVVVLADSLVCISPIIASLPFPSSVRFASGFGDIFLLTVLWFVFRCSLCVCCVNLFFCFVLVHDQGCGAIFAPFVAKSLCSLIMLCMDEGFIAGRCNFEFLDVSYVRFSF